MNAVKRSLMTINYEPIKSAKGKDLYSVRINQAYRAVVFHPSNVLVFVLLTSH